MRVVKYSPDNSINLPVSGGGSAMVNGALLKRGATPATMNGHLRLCAGNSTSSPDAIGILRAAHATADDTLVDGTVFTTKPIDIVIPYRIVRAKYSLATADLLNCTQAVSTTTLTLTSLEDDIDAAFLYVDEGLGAGQTNYLTASAAGSCTLKAAFGTSLDTTSYLVKILPRFHRKAAYSSDGTNLVSVAAVGVQDVIVIDSFIERDGHITQLNPVTHAALTGLQNVPSMNFWADFAIRDSAAYTID